MEEFRSSLTRKHFLTLWGYLQSLKDIYESRARDAKIEKEVEGLG